MDCTQILFLSHFFFYCVILGEVLCSTRVSIYTRALWIVVSAWFSSNWHKTKWICCSCSRQVYHVTIAGRIFLATANSVFQLPMFSRIKVVDSNSGNKQCVEDNWRQWPYEDSVWAPLVDVSSWFIFCIKMSICYQLFEFLFCSIETQVLVQSWWANGYSLYNKIFVWSAFTLC